MTIRVLDTRVLGADAVVRALERPPAAIDLDVQHAVDTILTDVRERGDAALIELTARFDRFAAGSAEGLRIATDEFETAERALAPATRAALAYAAERIERYHAAALPKSWGSPTSTAPSSVKKSGRSIAWASTFRAAAPRIPRPC